MADPRPEPPTGDEPELDELLDRFELAWHEDDAPQIEEFLPAGHPDRRALLDELIKIDLEYRWRRCAQGAGPRLEDYAARLPLLGAVPQLSVGLIAEEYRARQRWGDRPDHAEYAERFGSQGPALEAALARVDDELREELPTEHLGGKHKAPGAGPAPTPEQVVHLRCPHCAQPLDLAANVLPRDLACPACGGAFSVEGLAGAPGRAAVPPARRLGRYELGELLGSGAFGSVWHAWDTELSREVAVKVPRCGRFSRPTEEERFLREARSAAQLHHPGIVAVHDVGREGETVYIVSELVRGTSLAQRLRGGRLSFREAAELVAGVADALHHAHRQGVIHRDVKPSNILLAPDDRPGEPRSQRPLVTDFGLAKREVGEVTMTLDGQVLGTPAYMSPEQVQSPHAVDGRCDVYSLGVILYEMLTGQLPFSGTTRMLLLQVVSDEPRPPRRLNERIPRDLETICLSCLHKEPGRRYRTAGALAADLRRWLNGQPIQARPVGRLERLWARARHSPVLALVAGLGTTGVVAVTGAPAAAALVAVAAAALCFGLYKARTAAELAHAIEDVEQNQRKTAATLQYAFRNYSLARDELRRAVTSEARSRRRFGRLWELTRVVLFDFSDQIAGLPGAARSRAFLARAALACLDGLAQEAGDDRALLREVALAYGRVAQLQAGPGRPSQRKAALALASQRKGLEIFTTLAAALPDNAQARRDLAACRARVADWERALQQARTDSSRHGQSGEASA